MKEVQINEDETEDSRPILYRLQANGILVVALFDMGARYEDHVFHVFQLNC